MDVLLFHSWHVLIGSLIGLCGFNRISLQTGSILHSLCSSAFSCVFVLSNILFPACCLDRHCHGHPTPAGTGNAACSHWQAQLPGQCRTRALPGFGLNIEGGGWVGTCCENTAIKVNPCWLKEVNEIVGRQVDRTWITGPSSQWSEIRHWHYHKTPLLLEKSW